MATQTNKSAGQNTAAAKGAVKTPAPASEPRKRNFLSPQKAMAIAIAGLTAILNRKDVAALLSEPEQAQVKAAATMADDLNAQTIKPVQDRIAAIRTELTELIPKITEPGTATKVKDLSNELTRLQKRLETFTAAASA